MRPTCRLPNQLEVYCQSRSNAAYLFSEVFVDRIYQRHGISVADGDVIFDVGANIGMYLLLLNQLVTKATVFCFEPIPDIFETLRANAERHNHLDLRLMNCGLSREAGSAVFTYYPNSAGNSSMYPEMSAEDRKNYVQGVLRVLRGVDGARLAWPLRTLLAVTASPVKRLIAEIVARCFLRGQQVTCSLRTLSDVIDQYRPERIDLLKVDTESAEFDIIAGMREEHWPLVRQVVMEVHHGASQTEKMGKFLESRGFSVALEHDTPVATGNGSLYARRA
jgi:FkbM family methyltransferase